MTVIKLNSELYYENVTQNLIDAVSKMEEIIPIKNDVRYWYNFSEGRRLQDFLYDCDNINSEIKKLQEWTWNSKNMIEKSIDDLKDKASSLPSNKINLRKRINK